jgi:solute carrier family 44 (choline transporter-like protein), member 2/4/5
VPRDTDGYQCGQDSEVIDRKFLMFFDLAKCADPLVPLNGCPTPQTCVSECPQNNFVHDKSTCQKSLNDYKKHLICKRNVNVANIANCDEVEKLIDSEQCAKWYLRSEPCEFQISFCDSFFVVTNSTKRNLRDDGKLCK